MNADNKEKNIPDSMKRLLAFWQRSKWDSIKLIFLASRYFKICRYPSYEDRCLRSLGRDKINEFIKEEENLLKDFKKLYDDTQSRLKNKFPDKKTILLERRICKFSRSNNPVNDEWNTSVSPKEIIERKIKDKIVTMNMDILNSWAESSSDVYGVIKLKKEISFEDIIYFQHRTDHSGPLEFDEYIVLNKDNRGIITFNEEDIEIDEKFFDPLTDRGFLESFEYKKKDIYLFPFYGDKYMSLRKTLYYWWQSREARKR